MATAATADPELKAPGPAGSRRGLGKRVPTPTVLQMEAVECGAAALAIILAYYNKHVPLAELRESCGISRDGSKASSLLKAARAYGLAGDGFRKDLAALSEIDAPYIVFWSFNHFVVVEGFRGESVYLNDPATGPRTVSLEEFSKGFTGVVLDLKPGPDFKATGRPFSLISALSSRLNGQWSTVLFLFITGLFLAVPAIGLPLILQLFVDEVVNRQNSSFLPSLIVSLLVLLVLQVFLHEMQLRYFRRLNLALAVRMSGSFLWHLLRLPTSFFAQRYAGEMADRVRLNDEVASFLTEEFGNIAIQCVLLLIFTSVMILYDPALTAIAITFAVINVFALLAMQRRRADDNARLHREEGKATAAALGGLVDIETMKASGQEDALFQRWAGCYANALNVRQQLGISSMRLSVLPQILNLLAAAAVIILGGFRVIEGYISLGMLVAFQGLLLEFNRPILALVGLASRFQLLSAHVSRLDDVINNKEDQMISTAALPLEATGWADKETWLAGRLELKNITFGYNPCAAPLLTDFSLTIRPGERVALVGGSGSGKSTVARLVAGLLTPWKGDVLFDNLRRDAIPRPILAKSVTMVEQDIFLFHGSVKENLTLWDETVSADQIVSACKDAEIWEDILRLPGVLNAELIEGGANLSGGQRQRLEIARALISNPRLVILDEATSALDAETERLIDRNIRQRGCACLIVAHRLSTVRDCNEILVLSGGKIVERGTHDELCKANGEYNRLVLEEPSIIDQVKADEPKQHAD